MANLNCWEVKQCGREIGGVNVDELGVCPAASAAEYDGVNEGVNAGRFCWAIFQTLCDGKVQGTFPEKAMACMECPFYEQVVREQRGSLVVNPSQL